MKTQETKNLPIDRGPYEETFVNMMSSPKYVQQHFYAFVIAKMQVSINRSVPTAGAGFYDNNYQLVINPDFFNPLPLEQRMGILIHEVDHIILQHLGRKGERDHKLFNVACDIALNQMIPKDWLPDGALYPETFKLPDGNFWPKDLTAEQYYQLAKDEKDKQEKEKDDQDTEEKCDNCGGSGEEPQDGDQEGEEGEGEGQGEGEEKEGKEPCKECQGTGAKPGTGFQPSNGNPNLTGQEEITIDSHDMWDKMSDEDQEMAKEMMSKTLEQAMEKSRGNAPSNIEMIMELWRKKAKLSWKRILKKYLSSKKGQRVATIKKRNRRIRTLGVKGSKTAYDTPEVVVGLDTSGSMSNEEIAEALVEINEVCKISNSNLKLVQIDTTIKGLEEYDPKKKNFKRRGCGGTYMGAMAKFLKDEKIKYDVLVMISDMYIEDVSTDENWKGLKKPTLWLNTSGADVEWDGLKNHKIYNISDA